MRLVCLWSPRWSAGGAPLAELATALLEEAPRVSVEAAGAIWVDARGLPAPRLAGRLLARLGDAEARAGVAEVPIAAEVAARTGEAPVTVVEPGCERVFLAPHPLKLLRPDPRVETLLAGVGVERCGALAELSREAAEVRFGAEGGRLWRLARGDDPRLLFRPIPWERPHASLDFVDYQVSDAARLVFSANALLGSVCEVLRERGERARCLVLTLALGSGGVVRREIRAARPTAERGAWLERVRDHLERLVLPDTITGLGLEAAESEAVSSVQGDLFDRGFATASAVEEAAARLLDTLGPVFGRPEAGEHPLPEAREGWRALDPGAVAEGERPRDPGAPCLALQLLREPRRVAVRTRVRRGHLLPVEYLDRGKWRGIAEAAGPDRISGGHDGNAYAREYFRCVTREGRLVWLFRDALAGEWYLHGWWD